VQDPDFDHFCQLVRARSGLVLTPDKAYLVNSRLMPVARAEGLSGIPPLLARLRASQNGPLIQRCVDAMATHESFFFRDGTPFEQLAKIVLPQLMARAGTQRSLRIWCAACSSGQEPYSVAILLQELGVSRAGWQIEIVATDMADQILAKARSGLYSDFEARRGLSEDRLKRWFKAEDHAWRIDPALQRMVSFKPHNLLHGVAGMGLFDIILCRNVLIYFDVAQKRSILRDLARSMPADGSLLLGSAETVIGLTDEFELTPGARGLYRLAKGRS
jgi:chemotaxis protein methyltransferase CheR